MARQQLQSPFVPAKAGIQFFGGTVLGKVWVPAFAGTNG